MPRSQQDDEGTRVIVNKIAGNPCNRVLDIGAGEGKWGLELKGKVASIDAVEAFIKDAPLNSIYDRVYNQDIRQFQFHNQYDAAILGDVLEHLPYDDAVQLIKKLKEKVDHIYLVLPTCVCIQDGDVLGNPYETHRYHWSDREVRFDLGFNLIQFCTNENKLVTIGAYEWHKQIPFSYYTIAGKGVNMIAGHLANVTAHAGFNKLTCPKELVVVIYTNNKIPTAVTDSIIKVCQHFGATPALYPEPTDNFLENLYACWNLGYEKSPQGFVFRGGCDQAFNYNSFVNLYNVACRLWKLTPKVLLNSNTIEHAVRAMSNGNVSRHILADLGDTFENFNIAAFEQLCVALSQNVPEEILTIEDSLRYWGKPTSFNSTLGHINRTEGCSWLITKKDWETYGPMPPKRDGITGDCWLHDELMKAGYRDFMTRDCITYHFFRGESIERYK